MNIAVTVYQLCCWTSYNLNKIQKQEIKIKTVNACIEPI